jgi:hypothetical protein
MKIQELLSIMENRVVNLEETRKTAVASGLIDQVVALDADLSSTKSTILSLQQALAAST